MKIAYKAAKLTHICLCNFQNMLSPETTENYKYALLSQRLPKGSSALQ